MRYGIAVTTLFACVALGATTSAAQFPRGGRAGLWFGPGLLGRTRLRIPGRHDGVRRERIGVGDRLHVAALARRSRRRSLARSRSASRPDFRRRPSTTIRAPTAAPSRAPSNARPRPTSRNGSHSCIAEAASGSIPCTASRPGSPSSETSEKSPLVTHYRRPARRTTSHSASAAAPATARSRAPHQGLPGRARERVAPHRTRRARPSARAARLSREALVR